MRRNNRGISLIVLVITIIIMIILASAIIISLNNSNIINKANETVNSSNLNQVQHAAALICSDAYLASDIANESITADYIKSELEKNKV